MTFLDQLYQKFPELENIVCWIGDNSGGLFAAAFYPFLIFIFYLIFTERRKAIQNLKSLIRKGYNPIQPEDSGLAKAVEKLIPVMWKFYNPSNVIGIMTPWTVERAYKKKSGRSNMYFAHIRSTVHVKDVRYASASENYHTIAFFEKCELPFTQDIDIAGGSNIHELEAYELKRVDDKAQGTLFSLYYFYTSDGTLESLPSGFSEALVNCAPFLSMRAKRHKWTDPIFLEARLRFTPQG